MLNYTDIYTLKDISASQERLCHLLSKNYKLACAICWVNIILHSHPETEISFKFIPKILMSKECIHFFGPLCVYLNINQLDALNFIMSLFHASTCFEHTCSSSGGQNCIIQPLVSSHLQVAAPVHGTATYMCDNTRGRIVQFWPPDDEHVCSKHVEAWNKLIIKFSASSWLILR